MKYFIYLRFILTIIFTIVFPLCLTSPGVRWKLLKVKANFNDFVLINGTDYYLSTDEVSFNGAETICREHYMQLLTLMGENKTETMFGWLNDKGPEYANLAFWTGGWRDKNSSTWLWLPWGAQVAEPFWLPGEPRGDPRQESRIHFRAADKGWHDDQTRAAASVLCEITS